MPHLGGAAFTLIGPHLSGLRHDFAQAPRFQLGWRIPARVPCVPRSGEEATQLQSAFSRGAGNERDLFNIGSNRQPNLDSSEPAAFQRPPFIGRNTLRAPGVFELNARYSRFFPLAERYILEILAETTNLTNTLLVNGTSATSNTETADGISAQYNIASTLHYKNSFAAGTYTFKVQHSTDASAGHWKHRLFMVFSSP